MKRHRSIFAFFSFACLMFASGLAAQAVSRQLNEFLLNISKEPVDKQPEILNNRFIEWKGALEQIDDICIIGFNL